jgi:hypothetical protein
MYVSDDVRLPVLCLYTYLDIYNIKPRNRTEIGWTSTSIRFVVRVFMEGDETVVAVPPKFVQSVDGGFGHGLLIFPGGSF